jgi:hypothetical protein
MLIDGREGIAGFVTPRNPMFSALWNGKDAILKERLFGLTNNQGNHGEDVKELFSSSLVSYPLYCKYLYKYPQSEFPYGELESKTSEAENQNMKY